MIRKSPARRRPQPGAAGIAPGFTLIEVIGALAIAALIVGVAAQSGFERLKQTARVNESVELTQLVTGLERAVVRSRGVPAATNWVSLVATQLGKSTNQITKTANGETRVLLFDPGFTIGPSATGTLPFVQTAGGSLYPANARAVLVSSVAAALPPLTGTNFTALWNLAAGTLPGGWPSGWGGSASDLKVERIDFSRLFRRVILNNLDSTASAPYGVDGTNVVNIAPLTRVEGWFVDASLLNLYFSTLSLQARETLAEDTSYVFENGRWGRSVTYGTGAGATDFGQLVDAFVDSPTLNNTAAPSSGGTTGSGSTSGSSGSSGSGSSGSGSSGGSGNSGSSGNSGNNGHGNGNGNGNNGNGHGNGNGGHGNGHDDDDDDDDDHGNGGGHGNNGHGNNEDGVDSSNPGQGHGGPNGQTDPSGGVDDERHGCRSQNVADACHKLMKNFSEWSNRGCPRGGSTADTEHPSYRNVKNSCTALRDFSRNLCRR